MGVKYGATQWCFPGNGVFAIKNAAKVGLQGLQLELGCGANGYYMTQKRLQQDYLEEGEKYSIEFPSISLNDLDKNGYVKGEARPSYQIALDTIDMVIKMAKDMGIGTIMMPHYNDNAIVDEFTMENAAKVLKLACEKAFEYGLTIACESALNVKDQIILFEKIDMPNITLFYDSQNYHYFAGFLQKEMIEGLYSYIGDQLHVKDGFGHAYDGGALSCAMLGQGDSDFMSTVDYLKKKNYSGWLILENYYYSDKLRVLKEDVFEVMQEDIQYLKSLFDE